jgi:hypothetical protein
MMIKLGSILLFPRGGVLANVLSVLIKFLDPDPWVRNNWRVWSKYWHMAIVVGWDSKYNDWVVRSVEGGGAKYRNLKDFKYQPAVFNLITEEIDTDDISGYIQHHPCKGYDALGYIACAANRLSRGVIPAVEGRWMYCWEDSCEFCEFFGEEWMPYGEMAYMPVFVKAMTKE